MEHNNSDQPNAADVNYRLELFTNLFYSNFQARFAEYLNQLEIGTATPNKWHDFCTQIAKITNTSEKPPDALKILEFFEKIKYNTEIMTNLEGIQQYTRHLYIFKTSPHKVRADVVKAAIEIFHCFECQLMQSTCEAGSWQRALTKFANDAVGRAFDYFKHNPSEELSPTTITKGVLHGESQAYMDKTANRPRLLKGYTLIFKGSGLISTDKLFHATGLVTTKSDGLPVNYYKNGKSKVETYGYRRLFAWEIEERLPMDYRETVRPSLEYTYQLTSIYFDKVQLLDKIERMEPHTIEEGHDGLLEQFKQEAKENFEALLALVTKNFDKLTKALEEKEMGIRAVYPQTGQRPLPTSVNRVWFDIELPLNTYVHREGLFQQITEGLANGFVVLLGLAGMGKTEAVRKYAHDYCAAYDGNVIWINVSAYDTMRSSFHRLAREGLNISMRYEDKGEKPLEVIVKEVYEKISSVKSLFIFDSAESLDSIKAYLPINLGPMAVQPHVIITTKVFADWDCDKVNIQGPIRLGKFTDTEARRFVTSVLEIDDNERLSEFIHRLENFPLAIFQTTVCIKQKNTAYQKLGNAYTIETYMKEFERPQRNLLHSQIPLAETICKTLKVTLDKIKNKNSLEMLDIMSYFDKINIPSALFLKQLAHGNSNDLTNMIRELRQYSIAHLKLGMLSIHSFVQEVRRQWLSQNEKREKQILTSALRLLNGHLNNRKEVEDHLTHTTAVWMYACHYDELIELFVVKDAGYESGHTTFFHLMAASMKFRYFAMIVRTIEEKFRNSLALVVNAQDADNESSVHCAARNSDARTLRLLLEMGANVHATNKFGATPLHIAVQSGHLATVKALIDHNAGINCETELQYTPLHLAARNGILEIVEILLKNGADVNTQCSRRFTPLHYAAMNGHKKVVEALLALDDIQVNLQNSNGNTPLHLAAQKGYLDIVKGLIAKNAIVEIENGDGKLPLDLASETIVIDYIAENVK